MSLRQSSWASCTRAVCSRHSGMIRPEFLADVRQLKPRVHQDSLLWHASISLSSQASLSGAGSK